MNCYLFSRAIPLICLRFRWSPLLLPLSRLLGLHRHITCVRHSRTFDLGIYEPAGLSVCGKQRIVQHLDIHLFIRIYQPMSPLQCNAPLCARP